MLCQMINNLKMEQLRKTFQEEVKELWEDDREHYEDEDDLVEDKYNSVELTKYECMEFIGNDLDLIFDMEEEVCKYNVDEFGEVWEGRGICQNCNVLEIYGCP
jgi:hypothetical protein